MKKNLKLILAVLSIFISTLSYSQFTFTINDTDPYSGYIIPLKANDSYTQTVSVKNNTALSGKFSVSVSSLTSEWDITFTPSTLYNVTPGQTTTFQMEFTIPNYAQDGEYVFYYLIDFVDTNDESHLYTSDPLYITIDNTPPVLPTTTVEFSSYQINITDFDSWDNESIYYNNYNEDVGVDGIDIIRYI